MPPSPTDWRRRLPNWITLSRLILALVVFVMLAGYRFGSTAMTWWLFAAGWLWGLAAATDYLDGHLARKWNVQSAFGRIVDPFVDKILVLGTFVFLAGRNFMTVDDGRILSLSGVGPLAVVLLLARELLVTTIRGQVEAEGGEMGAKKSGKIKMIVQSSAIPTIFVYVFLRHWMEPGAWYEVAMRVLRDVAVWATVIVTLWSAWAYIPRQWRKGELV